MTFRPHIRLVLSATVVLWSAAASAQQPTPDPALVVDLVAANRILNTTGFVDGYGHVSVRDPRDPSHYLMSTSKAPGLVTKQDIVMFDLDSNPVDGEKRPYYLERFIHGEIYKARPEIMAVVHAHTPILIPFGDSAVRLRPLYHASAFLERGAPIYDIAKLSGATNMLVDDAKRAKALVADLGQAPIVLMRGHGVAVVGVSIPQLVYRAYYAELNAHLQLEATRLGKVRYLGHEEALITEKQQDASLGRLWALWKIQWGKED